MVGWVLFVVLLLTLFFDLGLCWFNNMFAYAVVLVCYGRYWFLYLMLVFTLL